MNPELLKLLVPAFKREGFAVAKGPDFIAFVSFSGVKKAYNIAYIIDEALSGSNYIASIVDLDEASKMEAMFNIKNIKTGKIDCSLLFVMHKEYQDCVIITYW